MTRTLRDATAEQFLAQIFFTFSCHAITSIQYCSHIFLRQKHMQVNTTTECVVLRAKVVCVWLYA